MRTCCFCKDTTPLNRVCFHHAGAYKHAAPRFYPYMEADMPSIAQELAATRLMEAIHQVREGITKAMTEQSCSRRVNQ